MQLAQVGSKSKTLKTSETKSQQTVQTEEHMQTIL